ncbi:hypothetical protein [Streptomyces sp. NRRL S-1824]|uniref:hypothetical protein n=1 Tax=Streptomyces sp. NRRL S-1824 TaxID=1463889 RepID=UPI002D21DAFC|nr:hypothetical protein [Streptomyces sp. NRRL S-1824]
MSDRVARQLGSDEGDGLRASESCGRLVHSVSCWTASWRASRAPRLVLLRRMVNCEVGWVVLP